MTVLAVYSLAGTMPAGCESATQWAASGRAEQPGPLLKLTFSQADRRSGSRGHGDAVHL